MTINPELLASLSSMELAAAPVAVAFVSSPPPGLKRIARSEPAGCGYWKLASEGQAFYTTPDDHVNCAVGAFTHGVVLSQAQGEELQALVGTMVELKYIRSTEVPAIPRRIDPLEVAAYAPLDRAPFEPDVVVFRGTVRQIMLLSEAAHAAGIFEGGPVMGRPACAMLPQTLISSGATASVGCIGNRVYTALDDGEMYLAVPGPKLEAMLGHLRTITNANAELEKFHRSRAAAFSGSVS